MQRPLSSCVLILSCIFVYSVHVMYVCNAAPGAARVESGPIVQTAYGQVEGLLTENARVFKGIPFGGSVSGANRWKLAGPPDPWTGTLSAKEAGPACPQYCTEVRDTSFCPPSFDEDCLFLNIYTPLDATESSKHPVMVFLYGGTFLYGASTIPVYDGSYLASTYNIVVVTINYRLGALGYLVYGDGNDAVRGDFGIMDQALGLQWVQDNINAFGGDKGSVTFSGWSAGAMSVSIHMTRNGGDNQNLFHKAIMESNPLGIVLQTVEAAINMGNQLASDLNCADIHCLRAKPWQDIVTAQNDVNPDVTVGDVLSSPLFTWSPVIGGNANLAKQPDEAFRSGEFTKLPAIIGTTSEEGVEFIFHPLFELAIPITFIPATLYEIAIRIVFGWSRGGEILDLYPSHLFQDHRFLMAQIVTDYLFYCPSVTAAGALAEHNPTYSYLFNQPWPWINLTPEVASVCNSVSCHGAEVPFPFHTTEFLQTDEQKQLATTVAQYWGNFIRTGDPNSPGQPLTWQSDISGTDQNRLISFSSSNSQILTNYRKNYCDHLNGMGITPDLFTALLRFFF